MLFIVEAAMRPTYTFKYSGSVLPLSLFLLLMAGLVKAAIASPLSQAKESLPVSIEMASVSASAQDLIAPTPLLVATISVSAEKLTASQGTIAIDGTNNFVAQTPTPTDPEAEGTDPNAPAPEALPEGTDPNAPVPEAPPTDGTDPNAPATDPALDGTGADPGVLAPPTADPSEVVTIPKSSAIIVSFPAELILDPKRQHNLTITLPLLQPIVDSAGQIVAPAKSLVSAQLKSMKGGDLIEVISVVVGGRVIPINTIGTFVPAQNKQEDVAALYNGSQTTRSNQVFTNLQSSNLLSGSFGGGTYSTPNTYDYLNLAVNLATGLTAPVTKLPPPFSNIPQGAVYIINLASPITVPKRLVQTGIEIRKQLGEEGTIAPSQ